MVKCRKWVLRSHFSGLPKREDLEIVEEELPPLKDGGKKTSCHSVHDESYIPVHAHFDGLIIKLKVCG